MLPRMIELSRKTYAHLTALRTVAEREGAYRVAKRLHAVLLSADGLTSGELSRILKAPRSAVSDWLRNFDAHGVEGILEGHRCGRPRRLTEEQRVALADIVESGPVAYGLDSGVWTARKVAWVVQEEFGVSYHPGHVQKLLHEIGLSVQRPHRLLARGDPDEQDRWHRYKYPNIKKKRSAKVAPSSLPTRQVSAKIRRSTLPGRALGTRLRSQSQASARASRSSVP